MWHIGKLSCGSLQVNSSQQTGSATVLARNLNVFKECTKKNYLLFWISFHDLNRDITWTRTKLSEVCCQFDSCIFLVHFNKIRIFLCLETDITNEWAAFVPQAAGWIDLPYSRAGFMRIGRQVLTGHDEGQNSCFPLSFFCPDEPFLEPRRFFRSSGPSKQGFIDWKVKISL